MEGADLGIEIPQQPAAMDAGVSWKSDWQKGPDLLGLENHKNT